jgi:hypothetical protein
MEIPGILKISGAALKWRQTAAFYQMLRGNKGGTHRCGAPLSNGREFG